MFRKLIAALEERGLDPRIVGVAVVVVLALVPLVALILTTGDEPSDSPPPPPDAPGAFLTRIEPDRPAAISAPGVEIAVPSGAVSSGVDLQFAPLTTEQAPAPPEGFAIVGSPFDLSPAASPDRPFSFATPIEVSMRFEGSDLITARGNSDNLVIQHYHDGGWNALQTTVNLAQRSAVAQVESLSVFALTVRGGGLRA